MPAPAAERANGGVVGAARRVAEHAAAVAKLELELATLELKKKLTSLGIGLGLELTAALLALFMLGFLFATIAAGLATFLPWWLALLIVTVLLGLLAAGLAYLGVRLIKKSTPPVPDQAIREAKLTSEAIKL